jgi:hypothetical protein
MKSAALKGKRIKRVHQSWYEQTSNRRIRVIDQIDFTDGSVLRFLVAEGEGGEYGVEPLYYPARAIKKGGES